QRLPQHEDNIMTLAERIEQKGIAKGIEQGKWKLEGKLETARNMLNAGMDRQTVLQMTGLSND
ncbi:Rpn family recombination-promoting nuclease/putative transposase, partial [Escherichia coli]|nr:Rpn family recombination-promoting nuclease/putative transposase [Escherichia coli]